MAAVVQLLASAGQSPLRMVLFTGGIQLPMPDCASHGALSNAAYGGVSGVARVFRLEHLRLSTTTDDLHSAVDATFTLAALTSRLKKLGHLQSVEQEQGTWTE